MDERLGPPEIPPGVRVEDLPVPELNFTPEQRDVLGRTLEFAVSFFEEAQERGQIVMGSHGFDHNQRVAGMAAVLAIYEEHDPFLPVLTALIFDIGRTSTDPRAHSWQHGRLGREMAERFVAGLPLTAVERELVLNAIEDHPKLNEQIPEERRSWLTKILMDADRLDTLGALAPVRAAATRWKLPLSADNIATTREEGAGMTTIRQDFAHRIPDWFKNIWTDTARRIAEARMPHLRVFIEEYDRETRFAHRAFRKIFEDKNGRKAN